MATSSVTVSRLEDPDRRTSAIVIGAGAIFLVVGFIIVVCLLDSTSWVRDFQRLKRNITGEQERKKKQVVREEESTCANVETEVEVKEASGARAV